MTTPSDDTVLEAADSTDASLALVLAEIGVMQRSSSVTNTDFADALRTCQDVVDSTLSEVQASVADGPALPGQGVHAD